LIGGGNTFWQSKKAAWVGILFWLDQSWKQIAQGGILFSHVMEWSKGEYSYLLKTSMNFPKLVNYIANLTITFPSLMLLITIKK
jgi:hypothetical protein